MVICFYTLRVPLADRTVAAGRKSGGEKDAVGGGGASASKRLYSQVPIATSSISSSNQLSAASNLRVPRPGFCILTHCYPYQ